MIKYSIITPSFKAEQFTKKCIESVSKFTKNYEHIIVAQECDLANFNNYPVMIINCPKNLGISKAWNLGMMKAQGYLWFMMANDVEVKPGWIKYYEKPFENNEKLASAISKIDMSISCWNPEFIRRWGGWDENIPFDYDDIEMQKRAFIAGWDIHEFEAMPFIHHQHKSGRYFKDRERIKEESRNYMNKKYQGWET